MIRDFAHCHTVQFITITSMIIIITVKLACMQAAGVTTVCIYAAHLIFRVRKWEPPLVRKPFSVRVMIPCYKEDIETLEETVECAIEAAKAAMAKGQTNAGVLSWRGVDLPIADQHGDDLWLC